MKRTVNIIKMIKKYFILKQDSKKIKSCNEFEKWKSQVLRYVNLYFENPSLTESINDLSYYEGSFSTFDSQLKHSKDNFDEQQSTLLKLIRKQLVLKIFHWVLSGIIKFIGLVVVKIAL